MNLNRPYSRHNILVTSFYIGIAVFEIVGECFNYDLLIYITKPLLMPLLICLYFPIWKREKDLFSKLLIVALTFAFLGDVFLMFVSFNENVFLLGLVAFMVTQIFYIIAFYQNSKAISFKLKGSGLLVLFFFIAIYVLLMNLLWHHLDDLLIPVLIYGAVVCTMGFTATLRKVNSISYLLVLIGALLFVASDSLIAINKFIYASKFPYAQFFIMFLYISAQYLVITGSIKSYSK